MYILENKYLYAAFNERCQLTELKNVAGSGENIIQAPSESFKLVFLKGTDWENVVLGSNQAMHGEQRGNTLSFTVNGVSAERAMADILLKLTVSLEGEKLVYGAEVTNRSDVLITDFEYPYIGAIHSFGTGALSLLLPSQCGTKVCSVVDYLAQLPDHREIHPHSICMQYPGGGRRSQFYGSMQWMALTDEQETLYFACHDADFTTSELRAQSEGKKLDTMALTMDTMAFVKQGEIWKAPEHLLEFTTGDWRHGAKEYADWARTWRPTHRKPDWVRNMLGYFLVICKQQFGSEMWKYQTIPELYRLAKRNGCDTVGLFGWFDTGHDNNYPDLSVSESLGGEQALKDGIQAVQREGGHVTMYFQGYLIDVASQYYREHGREIQITNPVGVPYYEEYNKSHQSSYLSHFPMRCFVTACPSCRDWQELMKKKADYVSGFGCDGVLFDQIGGMNPSPCFNPAHHHAKDKPSLAVSNGRKELLSSIQIETKKINPEFAFLTEHVTDVYAGYVDCLHGICSYPGKESERELSEEPREINYPELYRYCFPDDIITIRNPSPFIRPRAANYAFLFGFRFEMEIRYQADCDDILTDTHAEWRDYAASVTALRRKYWDILGNGTFRDRDLIHSGGSVIAKAYEKGSRVAVALWNDSNRLNEFTLDVPGFDLVEFSTVEGTGKTLPKVLAPQQIALALYRKREE